MPKRKEFVENVGNLLAKKEQIKHVGYTSQDFNDDYWLRVSAFATSRAGKSAVQILAYLKDLFIKTETTDPKDYTILDVGAGAGAIVSALLKTGYDAYGCEFSESGRRIAKEMYNLRFNPCDLRKYLFYEDNEFDWSLCIGVLSMIPESKMENAISELLRVTRYGVFVNVETAVTDIVKLDSLFDVDLVVNPHHLTRMLPQTYWKLFNKCGAYDWTSIQPPQKSKYGIGMDTEFSGLFSKQKWCF